MDNRENKIKENVKKVAYFAMQTKKQGTFCWLFRDMEKELQMSKSEIISILDLFTKARIFYYQLMPLGHGDEDYEIFPTQEMIENRTGCFNIFFDEDSSKAFTLFSEYTKNREKDKEFEKKLKSLNKINDKEKVKQKYLKKILTLQQLTESPTELNKFLKKYGKHLKIPITSNEAERYIGELKLNTITGNFTYYKTKGNFPIKNQEFKLLNLLINSPDYQSDHDSIAKTIYSNLDSSNKTTKFRIQQIIKKIKIKLNILPKSKKTNPNFILNIPNVGYKLIVE